MPTVATDNPEMVDSQQCNDSSSDFFFDILVPKTERTRLALFVRVEYIKLLIPTYLIIIGDIVSQ